jgi:predicted phage-related endonuclease
MSQLPNRRSFIGGSDARVIMGDGEADLVRLWREKRGELEAEDLADNLIVQLGIVTEELNRRWYERNTGHAVKDVQKRIQHPINKWMAATLDGLVEPSGAVFEAKFMLPWTFSEEAAAEKHMAQLQHNMWVANARSSVLSIVTGGGKWVEMTIFADPLYQHLLITAEKKFLALCSEWRHAAFVWNRAAAAAPRGRADCRYERLQLLGGVRGDVSPHPPGLSGARGRQGQSEEAGAGRCQGGHRTWFAGQALQIGGHQLRGGGNGGGPCTA